MSESEDEIAVMVVVEKVNAATGVNHRVFEHHLFVWEDLHGVICVV